MAFHGDSHVVTCPCVILWDGITRPEPNDSGKMVHSLKLAMLPSAPEYAELNKICKDALTADAKFRGNMPPNGCYPLQNCDPNKFEGKLAGYVEFNCKTFNGAPQVFDVNNKQLDPMFYGPMLYPGALVQVVVHAYTFDNKSKGVALGLDGIRIVDATAPRLPVGGVDAGAAFGGAPAPAVGQAPPFVAPTAQGNQYAPAVGGMAPNAMGAAPPVGAGTTNPPPLPGAPVQPNPGFLNPGAAAPPAPPAPPAKQMTAAANGVTYEQYIAANWTDALLIQHGFMLP